MKKLLYSTILILFFALQANADTTATQTFIVDAENTVTVNVTGNMASSLNVDTGELTTPISINFNIESNADLSNIQLKAFATDSSSNKDLAFHCTTTTSSSSLPIDLTFSNNTHLPTSTSIASCCCDSSMVKDNPDSIAYSGNVTIDNNGALNYIKDSGYINANLTSGTTNLNLTLNTAVKSGTYDSTTGLDEEGDYKVEIYLDNIP